MSNRRIRRKWARRALEELQRQSDELMAAMQTPEALAAMDRAFTATPEEMGRAAVDAARGSTGASG
jgi:hypothetical protein